MIKALSFLLCLAAGLTAKAVDKDSVVTYQLPDTVKAVQFIAEIKTNFSANFTRVSAGIKTDIVKLYLNKSKNKTEIVFEFPESSRILSQGINVDLKERSALVYPHNWVLDSNYKLMIAVAGDSAGNFSLYSGYAWLPVHNKWKLIGTCKVTGRWSTIKQPAVFFEGNKKQHGGVIVQQAWVQRSNGSWKNLDGKTATSPVVNLTGHIDSTVQRKNEVAMLEKALAAGQLETSNKAEDVYYKILKQGMGRQVSVTDTVIAFY